MLYLDNAEFSLDSASNSNVSIDETCVFVSHDLRWLNTHSSTGAHYKFIGGCTAMSALWLSNVAEGLPMKMTRPDHVIATLIQLKYLEAGHTDRVERLLSDVGLYGQKALYDVDGTTFLDEVKSAGDNMFLLKTRVGEDIPFALPQVLAFVRRDGDTFFFDPAHGLFRYGPQQSARLFERFLGYGYDAQAFSCWTVSKAPLNVTAGRRERVERMAA